MRKAIIALSVLVAIALNAKAQNNPVIYTIGAPAADKKDNTDAKRGIAFGPEIGLNMADMALKASGGTTSTSFKAGLAVGGVVDFGFNKNIYLQPGLFFLMNGCNVSASGSGAYSSPSRSDNLSTIQLPINVLYKLSKPGKNRIFFGLGPYVAYNIGANVKSGGKTTTITIGDNTGDIKALDFGAGINAGYQFAMGVLIRVHYQMGFANLDPDPGGTATTSAIGLTVGYLFGGKPKKPSGS